MEENLLLARLAFAEDEVCQWIRLKLNDWIMTRAEERVRCIVCLTMVSARRRVVAVMIHLGGRACSGATDYCSKNRDIAMLDLTIGAPLK